MNIIEVLWDRLFGKPVVLTIMETSVRISQGRKAPEYELPKNWQGYKYLNHAEEMANWLQAILKEEKIRIRRFRIVLDSGQVYLQTVKLPFMTAQEQKNWVRWEGSRYVPFDPGNYQAVLLRLRDSGFLRTDPEEKAVDTAELSARWQETEETGLQDFLLVAVPLEMIEVLQQFAGFLKAKLEAVTVMGPKQELLPVNLLPSASGKEVILKRGYQIAAVSCLLISLFLAVQGVIRWQRAKSEWQEAGRQLVPFRSVKAAYEDSRKTDFRIRQYQRTLQHINLKEPVWTMALQTIGMVIPEGCWLEELRQKQPHSGTLEIKGCALDLDRISEFLERLKREEVFSVIRLVESGTRQIKTKDGEDNVKTVISFLILSDLAPTQAEEEKTEKITSKRSFLFLFCQILHRRRRRRRDREANVVVSYKGGKTVFPEEEHD